MAWTRQAAASAHTVRQTTAFATIRRACPAMDGGPGSAHRAGMRDYRRLAVFWRAHAVALFVHRITRLLPKDERFGVGQQMRAAARSVAANLVEGCGRRTRKDLARFVDMATGSANELRYYGLLCRDLDYLSADICAELDVRATGIIRMLAALARALRTTPAFSERSTPGGSPTPRAKGQGARPE